MTENKNSNEVITKLLKDNPSDTPSTQLEKVAICLKGKKQFLSIENHNQYHLKNKIHNHQCSLWNQQILENQHNNTQRQKHHEWNQNWKAKNNSSSSTPQSRPQVKKNICAIRVGKRYLLSPPQHQQWHHNNDKKNKYHSHAQPICQGRKNYSHQAAGRNQHKKPDWIKQQYKPNFNRKVILNIKFRYLSEIDAITIKSVFSLINNQENIACTRNKKEASRILSYTCQASENYKIKWERDGMLNTKICQNKSIDSSNYTIDFSRNSCVDTISVKNSEGTIE